MEFFREKLNFYADLKSNRRDHGDILSVSLAELTR